jgi:amino acid adenylation domain-containing protein
MDSHHNISLVNQAISLVLGVTLHAITNATTFVELGGDSLSAILISAECQRRGIAITSRALLQAHTLNEAISQAALSAWTLPVAPVPPAQIPVSEVVEHSIRGKKVEEATSQADGKGISVEDILARVDISQYTESQLLLLRGNLQNPKLNIVTLHETYTQRDIENVCKAWTGVILAEPIFAELIKELKVPPQDILLWRVIQVDTEEAFESEAAAAMNACNAISRCTVIHFQTEKKFMVVWRIHHAFIDGYSARILLDKVDRSLRGETVPPGLPFREAISVLRTLRHERRASTRHFWATQGQQYPSAVSELRLGPQRAAGAGEVFQRCLTIQFPDERLSTATARTGYTKAVYLAAAWALTLSKFMDADQVCFGLVLSGRDLPIPGAFETVGPLINMLPLFASTADCKSSVDLLQCIHQGILELNGVEHSESSDGFDRNFDSIMATQFECDGTTSQAALAGNKHRSDMQSSVPLNLIIEQRSRVQMLCATARYSEEDAENIASVFQHSMESLLQGDPRLQDTLPCEMEDEVRRWSNCDSEATQDESKGDDLVTLFESVVARRPRDVAIAQGGSTVSYDDLDRAAATVARALHWIGPNEAVCVFADRSVNWLVAIFGILKAGGVYAPLDPSAPIAVRQANFVRSGARALLVPSCTSQNDCLPHQGARDSAPFRCLAVDHLLSATRVSEFPEYPRRRIARPDDLAYICFTSGSTGQPKAVQCTHKGLVAFQKDRHVRLGAKRGITVAQIMSPVFDGSIHEIFSALTYGAALRLASSDQAEPFSHLQESEATILTPSIAKVLCPDDYPWLKNVYLVGEVVPQPVCDAWAQDRLLYNMYGPTEATCGATIKRLMPGRTVTLGRPNPSSRVYILDRHHRLLPPGAIGELYLAGIQVSHGYINLPIENAERFLDDSIMVGLNEKMYKTGDYGYWDSTTGEISLVGRKDRQIKLRGFRLDLDDLETRLITAIPDCQGAAIFRQVDHLIAAYQAPSVTVASAKDCIRQALPPYAMPRKLISLAKFPLTAAGKLDYKSLEAMSEEFPDGCDEPEETTSATEKMLIGTVRRILQVDSGIVVEKHSDFVMLGGHSIMQLQLANHLSSHLKRPFTLRTIIENPIISELASAIEAEMKNTSTIDHPTQGNIVATLGERGVSPIELDWFLRYEQNLGTSSFNVSHVSKLEITPDQRRLIITSWNVVLARHAILRCRFRHSAHGVEKVYTPDPPTTQYLRTFDIRNAINREFDLEKEHPIRVLVSDFHMLVCVSHIICDYTTLNRLFEEFTAEYSGIEIPIPGRLYQDTQWDVKVPQATGDFWNSYLSGVELSGMPDSKHNRTSYAGKSSLFQLSPDAVPKLSTVSRSCGLTMHQIALGIVSLVLQADSMVNQDMVLGSPFLGRQEADMRTVGLFVQPLPIRIPVFNDPDQLQAPVSDFLKAVQKSAQSALSHGVGWSVLMDIISASDNESLRASATMAIPNHPLFNAMVTFHELGKVQSANITGVEPLISWAEGSKFAIMFEFTAVSPVSVTLRIEYDSSLFSSQVIHRLVARINTALKLIYRNPSVAELKQSLRAVNHDEIEELEFGTPLSFLLHTSQP